MAKELPIKRYRISVPLVDESVHAWLEAQGNISYSIRSLIKEDVQRHGYKDATCRTPDAVPVVPSAVATTVAVEPEQKVDMIEEKSVMAEEPQVEIEMPSTVSAKPAKAESAMQSALDADETLKSILA